MVSFNCILALILVSATAQESPFKHQITGQFEVRVGHSISDEESRDRAFKEAIDKALAEVSGVPQSQVATGSCTIGSCIVGAWGSRRPGNGGNYIQLYYQILVTDEQSTTAFSSLSAATNSNIGAAIRLAAAGISGALASLADSYANLADRPSVNVEAKTTPIIATWGTSTTTTTQCISSIPGGATVNVLGITYPSIPREVPGLFFLFRSDEWSAVFGTWESGSTHNIEQFRCGAKIWQGSVEVWKDHNPSLLPSYGRRSPGYSEYQWQVNDMIRMKTATTTTAALVHPTANIVAPRTGFSIQSLSATACPVGHFPVASETECRAAAARLAKPYHRKIDNSQTMSNCFWDEHYDECSFNIGGSTTAWGYAVCATEAGTSERFSGVVSFSLPDVDKALVEHASRIAIAAYFSVVASTVSTFATESLRLGAGSRHILVCCDWSVVFEFQTSSVVAAAVANKVAAIAATPYLFKAGFAEQFQAHLRRVGVSSVNLYVTGITAKHHTTGLTDGTTSEGGTSGAGSQVSEACKAVASIAIIIVFCVVLGEPWQ